jgi:PAS domain S-box-containing protein
MVDNSISGWNGIIGCQRSVVNDDCYRSVVEHSTIGFYRSTPDGRILMANPALLDMLGYSSLEELSLRNLEHDCFDDLHQRPGFKNLLDKEGVVVGLESRWKRQDGSIIWVREAARAVRNCAGEILYYDGTVEDITARKQAEEAVAASWNEKDALFRELQHRIKNSIATVLCLINMEMDCSEDNETRGTLQTLGDRVRSIGNLYTLLHASGSAQLVHLDDYLEMIVHHLLGGYAPGGSRVTCDVTAESLVLNARRSVPMGLIANELVTNALKHAFPAGKEGHVSVTLHREGKMAILCVTDNGVGLPRGFDCSHSRGLGMELVQMLTHQLRGTLTYESFGYTAFRVAVPIEAEEARLSLPVAH